MTSPRTGARRRTFIVNIIVKLDVMLDAILDVIMNLVSVVNVLFILEVGMLSSVTALVVGITSDAKNVLFSFFIVATKTTPSYQFSLSIKRTLLLRR